MAGRSRVMAAMHLSKIWNISSSKLDCLALFDFISLSYEVKYEDEEWITCNSYQECRIIIPWVIFLQENNFLCFWLSSWIHYHAWREELWCQWIQEEFSWKWCWVSCKYTLQSTILLTYSTVSIKTLRRKTIAMFPRQPSQSVMRMLSYDWMMASEH